MLWVLLDELLERSKRERAERKLLRLLAGLVLPLLRVHRKLGLGRKRGLGRLWMIFASGAGIQGGAGAADEGWGGG